MKKISMGLMLSSLLAIQVGCGEEAPVTKPADTGAMIDSVKDTATDAVDATKEAATDAIDATKEAATDAIDATKDAAKEVAP